MNQGGHGMMEKRGDSPLHLAVRTGNLCGVRHILHNFNGPKAKELLAKQNLCGETPLYVAAENGQADVIAEMLKHTDLETASITAKNGFDPFHVAAKKGHVEVLKQLLGTFPSSVMTTDINCTTSLHTAAAQGHIDVVNLLLETNSDLAKIARSNGKIALHAAARNGHLEVVKSLLNKDLSTCFKIDKKGQTALHMAVKGQCMEIVLELLKPDPSILHMKDYIGNTPLHIATRKGRAQNVLCLLSVEGININSTNKSGENPLDLAEKVGHLELVSILKEAGATNFKGHGKPKKEEPKRAQESKKGIQDPNIAGLLDIKYAMESFLKAAKKGKALLIIESNSSTSVKWIKDYESRPKKLGLMLKEIDTLISEIGTVVFKVVLEEANNLEDSSAKVGVEKSFKFCAWW